MLNGTFDVVVLGFRPLLSETSAAALARLSGLHPLEAERLCRSFPCRVLSGVSYTRAETLAASLHVAGADVEIAPHGSFSVGATVQDEARSEELARLAPEPQASASRATLVGEPPFHAGSFGVATFRAEPPAAAPPEEGAIPQLARESMPAALLRISSPQSVRCEPFRPTPEEELAAAARYLPIHESGEPIKPSSAALSRRLGGTLALLSLLGLGVFLWSRGLLF